MDTLLNSKCALAQLVVDTCSTRSGTLSRSDHLRNWTLAQVVTCSNLFNWTFAQADSCSNTCSKVHWKLAQFETGIGSNGHSGTCSIGHTCSSCTRATTMPTADHGNDDVYLIYDPPTHSPSHCLLLSSFPHVSPCSFLRHISPSSPSSPSCRTCADTCSQRTSTQLYAQSPNLEVATCPTP